MSIYDLLVFAYVPVEAALAGLLFYRRVWKTFPLFLSYCCWDILSNISLYTIENYYHEEYFHVYFAQSFVDSALMFCVLVELTWSVLRPIRASLPRITLVVIGILILLAGVAIWPFAAISGITHSREALLLAQLQHTVSILRILIFLLLAAGSQFLSIGWRDRELQIATGLGFFSLASVAVAILQTHQSTTLQYVRLQEFVPISFLISLLYWLVTFAQQEAERRAFTPQMQSVLLAVSGAARTTRVALEDTRADKSRKQDHR